MMGQNRGYNVLAILIALIFSACESPAQVTISKEEIAEYNKVKQRMLFSKQDSVCIKLSYMAYACGDCYPQYRIDSVLYSREIDKSFYLNKEVYVEFVAESLRKQTEAFDCSGQCYSYLISGILKRNGFGILKLEAVEGTISKIKVCCDKDK